MSQEPTRVTRWRRRTMPKIRVTWLGMVAVFCILVHQQLLRLYPMGMAGRVLLFIAVVLLPVLAATLWRAGLLPPERYEEDAS